jgi:hypothetical protein
LLSAGSSVKSLEFGKVPSSQQHECRKYIGLVCRVKQAGSFLFGIPCWDNTDLEARENVFVMNGLAFVVFRSNESRTLAAYGKVLLRHIAAIDKANKVQDDYVARE